MTPESEEPWDRLRVEEELRKLREHADAVQARWVEPQPPPSRGVWLDRIAPWLVPAMLTVTIALAGWVVHQHDVDRQARDQQVIQNQSQDLKLAGMEVRLLAMEQTIQALRSEHDKIGPLAARMEITETEIQRLRNRMERVEQRR